MSSPGSDRDCYKAIREKARNVMEERTLSEAELREIIRHEHAMNWPNAKLNVDDLVGACLHWQRASLDDTSGAPETPEKPDYKAMIASAGLLRQGADLTKAILTAAGIELPVAFAKWLAKEGHWEREYVVEDAAGNEWPLYYGRWLDPKKILQMDTKKLTSFRSEFSEIQREQSRRSAKRKASRPTHGRLVHGVYRRTLPGNRRDVLKCEFDWGVAARDGTIYLPEGRRKDASGRQIQWYALRKNGQPVVEPIPVRPKGTLPPDVARTEDDRWRRHPKEVRLPSGSVVVCDESVWVPDDMLGYGVLCLTPGAAEKVLLQGAGSEGVAWVDGVAQSPDEAAAYVNGLKDVVSDEWVERLQKYISCVRRGDGKYFWDRFAMGRRFAQPSEEEEPDGPHFEAIPEKTYLIGWFYEIAPGHCFAEPVSDEEELKSYCREARVFYDPRWISEHPWYRPGMTEHI